MWATLLKSGLGAQWFIAQEELHWVHVTGNVSQLFEAIQQAWISFAQFENDSCYVNILQDSVIPWFRSTVYRPEFASIQAKLPEFRMNPRQTTQFILPVPIWHRIYGGPHKPGLKCAEARVQNFSPVLQLLRMYCIHQNQHSLDAIEALL